MDVTELHRVSPAVGTPGVDAQDVSALAASAADGLNTPDTPAAKASDADRDAASIASHSLTPTDSPCVAVCSTLYDDICRGCGRTAMEVANWVFLDDEEKREVWLRIKAQGYPRRKG
jgi:predicted Fe-S protein YdhL (DUF1289 family)